MTPSQERRLAIATVDGIVDVPGERSAAADGRRQPAWPATFTVESLLGTVPSAELLQLTQRVFSVSVTGSGLVRSVLFSSLDPDRGSDAICAGAAHALSSQTTDSVCIVDANLRSRSLSDSFGLSAVKGLSNVLAENAPVAECCGRLRENLWFLPAGTADPEARLSALAIGNLHSDLLASFDYVLIESSGVARVLDLTIWAPAIDGAVLVLDAGVTRREAALRTAETLRAAQIKVLGAVLRNRSYPVPDAIYRRL
jgi:Mrp family chromosome partitioning ATPase